MNPYILFMYLMFVVWTYSVERSQDKEETCVSELLTAEQCLRLSAVLSHSLVVKEAGWIQGESGEEAEVCDHSISLAARLPPAPLAYH